MSDAGGKAEVLAYPSELPVLAKLRHFNRNVILSASVLTNLLIQDVSGQAGCRED
jgi:hypothetical protein